MKIIPLPFENLFSGNTKPFMETERGIRIGGLLRMCFKSSYTARDFPESGGPTISTFERRSKHRLSIASSSRSK
jgi:hypothetical protein